MTRPSPTWAAAVAWGAAFGLSLLSEARANETSTTTASAASRAEPLETESLNPAEPPLPPLEAMDTSDLTRTFIEMVVVLGGVCLLAYLLLGKLLPKVLRVPTPTSSYRLLKIVDRLPLDPKRSLMVVALGEAHFLVGSSEQGLSLLARLDSGEVRDAVAAAAASSPDGGARGWRSAFGLSTPKTPETMP